MQAKREIRAGSEAHPRSGAAWRVHQGTHVQDIAAAGQVAAVGHGRPSQVHAAFGSATRWSLAIRGETKAAALYPSLPPPAQWTARKRETVLFPTVAPQWAWGG